MRLTIGAPPPTEIADRDGYAVFADHISFSTGGRDVLREASLMLERGETMLVVGRNGAGKSTLLRILAGVERPATGSVLLLGNDVVRNPQRAARLVGYVPQDPVFDPELTVREVLVFQAQCAAVPDREQVVAADSMLQLFDLFDLRHRASGQLSRGQRQRLAWARALVHDPEVFLLDEPLVPFDQPTQLALIEMLFELKAMGKTLLVATAHPETLESWTDSLALIGDGQVMVGPVSQFRTPGEGRCTIRIGVLGDAERALAVLRSRGATVTSEPEEASSDLVFLRFEMDDAPEPIAELVRELAAGGVAVLEFYREAPTLVGLE